MKKILAIVMAFSMLFAMAACSQSSGTNTTPAANPPAASTPSSNTPAPSAPAANPEFTLVVSHWAAPTDFAAINYAKFAENVEKRSGGRIKGEVYGQGSLTQDRTAIEFVRDNNVQVASAPTFIIAEVMNDPRWFAYTLPFEFTDALDYLYYMLDNGDAFKILKDDLLSKNGIRVYTAFDIGMQAAGNSVREIKSNADYKGLKIRTAETELMMGIMEACQASPTPMNFGEVYTGLQQKLVDGVVTMPNLMVQNKFADFVKYLDLINFHGAAHTLMMNDSWYQSLPDDLKTIVDEEANTLIEAMRKDAQTWEKDAIETMKGQGVTVTYMTEERLAECRNATAGVYQKFVDKIGSDFMKVFNADKAAYQAKAK